MFPVENGQDFPIEYVPGGTAEFVIYIKSLGESAQVTSVDGKMRWVVTREDGSRFVARPQETELHAD